MNLAERLAETFTLGVVRQPLALAATGWGGHNQVFRLETSDGTWAVKRHGRPLTEGAAAVAFAVETAAQAGGVPAPAPVLARDGRCWVTLDGAWFRCHEWVEGTAKENEDTSASEAEAMGRIVARLHGLAIPCLPRPRRTDQREKLALLVEAGRQRGAIWADRVLAHAGTFDSLAAQPGPGDLGAGQLVGSHQDLNAHNVLFGDAGLWLVDWDAAGPAWPRWERADFAVRWASRTDGSYDESVARAFLRGYLDGGGTLDADDPAVLAAAPAALLPWVVQNIEMAVLRNRDEQDELAAVMVDALLDMPRRVARQQAVLAAALAGLV